MSNVAGQDNAPNRDQRFERLVEKYQEPILRMCYLYLCDKTLAQDAVQETFLKAYRTMDETKILHQDTGLFDEPELSVTKNGITVMLDQCIKDTTTAYIAFRIKGYTPPAGKEPGFDMTEVTVEGLVSTDHGWIAKFFDGLVTDTDGTAIYPDGSVPEDYGKISYTDENGDLVYIISFFVVDGQASMIGRRARVTLSGLGVYVNKFGDMEIAAQDTWEFEWQLKGSDKHLDLEDLATPVGETGATLTKLHLSPIHAGIWMTVPRETGCDDDSAEDNAPHFCGVRYKDGTVYTLFSDLGAEGYENPDSDTYSQFWSFDHIIDPDQVQSLLFTSPVDDSGLTEVNVR